MDTTPPSRRVSPIGVECLVYLAFGMPVAMLGVAWPTLRDELGRADGDLGVLVLAYGLGRLVTSASSGPILRRLRFGLASALTLGGLALSGVWVATRPAWAALVVAFTIVGVLSGVLDSLGARFLAVSGSVRRAGLAAGSYGVGATVGPIVIALTDSVAVGFLTGAFVAFVAGVLVVAPGIDWPAGLDSPPVVTAAATGEPLGFGALLRTPAVLVSLGLFAAFVSVEVTAGGWLATVLEDARDLDGWLAGLSVGGFWAGITIGRLLLGRFDLPDRALLLGVVAMASCFAGLAFVPAGLVLPLAVVAGLAVAPQFPTLLAHTGTRVGETLAGRVSGYQLIAANLGATGLAALTGVIVSATGPAAPLVVLIAVSLTGGLLLLVAPRVRPVTP